LRHGLEPYFGSSVKGEAEIDWDNEEERRALLQKIVADADLVLELARQAQGEFPADSPQRQGIGEAAELLGQLLLQDVERQEDGPALKDGVSRDRIPSVHDPEMRHGRKSSRRRFDGHKAAVVVDTDSQLVTAVDILPGNAGDNTGVLELVGQSEENTGNEVVAPKLLKQRLSSMGENVSPSFLAKVHSGSKAGLILRPWSTARATIRFKNCLGQDSHGWWSSLTISASISARFGA